MKNPFIKKKKLPTTVKSVVANNKNSISGPISGLPSNLSPIVLPGVSGSYGVIGVGVQGISGCVGTMGIQGPSNWSYSSASTYTWLSPEQVMEQRKKELMKEYEQNPELFSEIIVELRKQKIRQLKEKSTHQ